MNQINLLFVFILAFNWHIKAQVVLEYQTDINETVSEVSGIIWIDGKLIGHNDSGDDALLYELNPETGAIERTVTVENATNVDWEDITYDDDFIYIGDFGNNNGSRTDLRVYKINQSDFFAGESVLADTIMFNYAEQTEFDLGPYRTNYDAESLISLADSLYIFTKNWGDLKTNIYALSKNPGEYTLHRKDSLDPNCLITGATYNAELNEVYLSGYELLNPFVYYLAGFTDDRFSEATSQTRFVCTVSGSNQVEGIEFVDEYFYLTAEAKGGSSAALYKGYIDFTNIDKSINDSAIFLYPNPSSNIVHIENIEEPNSVFYDLKANIVLKSSSKNISLNTLSKGIYIVELSNKDGKLVLTQQVVKK